MTGTLIAIAHRGARGVEQAAGTIGADARPAFTSGDIRLHGGTVRALLTRGLISGTVRHADVWSAWTTTDYVLTPAGWDALAIAHGVQVRPEWDTPDTVHVPVADLQVGMVTARGRIIDHISHPTPDGTVIYTRTPTLGAGAGPELGATCLLSGETFPIRCAHSDASDAHGDEVDAPGEEPDSESEPVLGGGDGSIVDGWPADSGDLLRMAVSDILDGFTPMTCEPLRTATVPRAYRTGGDGAYTPTAHPADPDGGSPFWRACKTITLPPLR